MFFTTKKLVKGKFVMRKSLICVLFISSVVSCKGKQQTAKEQESKREISPTTGFKKQDLQKWHEWYDKEYGQKNN